MRIALVGVGLIGGSIGLAARRAGCSDVAGFDASAAALEEALARGALTRKAADPADAVTDAEAVFVCVPVGAIDGAVKAALAAAPSQCVVSDVGSTKRAIVAAADDPRFVGGHPLAGAETAGVGHARADLFEGATWYLTPARGSTAGVLYERLHALLRGFGARPAAIDAATHDRLMANISHLPHVLANLLCAQAAGLLRGESPARPGEQLPAIGPSFRDAIRVAGANSAIWGDIYTSNSDALLAALDELGGRIEAVRTMLTAGDTRALREWTDLARSDRDALLGEAIDGDSVHELRVHVPNRPGVIAEIALALGEAGVNIGDLALSPSRDNSRGVVALWVGGERQAARAQELVTGLGFAVVRA